jgi:nicotianamine synthase
MDNIEGFKNKLYLLHDQISESERLKHSKEFDLTISILRKLLETNVHIIDDALLDPKVKSVRLDLQKQISRSFYSSEEEWSIKISKNRLPKKAIMNFPDYAEYRDRTYFELNTASDKEVKKVLFVGSGPVPITAILLANKNIHVDCVDINPEACNLAAKLTFKLGLEKYINYIVADVLNLQNIDAYDIVWVAVLAGETNEEKARVVRFLCKYLDDKQALILRTGYGPGKFLYAEVAKDDLQGFSSYLTNQTPFSGFIQTYYVRKLK